MKADGRGFGAYVIPAFRNQLKDTGPIEVHREGFAKNYGVPVKRLNEQVKRNSGTFPEDFAFKLSANEWTSLRSQDATLTVRDGVNTASIRRQRLPSMAEIDNVLLAHNAALRDIYEKLRPLLASPPEPPKPQIGFRVREQAPSRHSRSRSRC